MAKESENKNKEQEEFDEQDLEEEKEEAIEETSEEEEFEDFERFMSSERIVSVGKSSQVLENDAPIQDLEVDLTGGDGGGREANEKGNSIQYVSPVAEDEVKKYIMSEERKARPRVQVADFDFGAPDIIREDSLRRTAPQDNFLNRELESGRVDFKGDYDIEKEYIPLGEEDSLKPKRKMPWQR